MDQKEGGLVRAKGISNLTSARWPPFSRRQKKTKGEEREKKEDMSPKRKEGCAKGARKITGNL